MNIPVTIDAKFVQYVHHERMALELWARAEESSVAGKAIAPRRIGVCAVPLRGVLLRRDGVEGWHAVLSDTGAVVGRVLVSVAFAQYRHRAEHAASAVAAAAAATAARRLAPAAAAPKPVAPKPVEAKPSVVTASAAPAAPASKAAAAAASAPSIESGEGAQGKETAPPKPPSAAFSDPLSADDTWHTFKLPWLSGTASASAGDAYAAAPSLTSSFGTFATLGLDLRVRAGTASASSAARRVVRAAAQMATTSASDSLSWVPPVLERAAVGEIDDVRGGGCRKALLRDNLRDLDTMLDGLRALSPSTASASGAMASAVACPSAASSSALPPPEVEAAVPRINVTRTDGGVMGERVVVMHRRDVDIGGVAHVQDSAAPVVWERPVLRSQAAAFEMRAENKTMALPTAKTQKHAATSAQEAALPMTALPMTALPVLVSTAEPVAVPTVVPIAVPAVALASLATLAPAPFSFTPAMCAYAAFVHAAFRHAMRTAAAATRGCDAPCTENSDATTIAVSEGIEVGASADVSICEEECAASSEEEEEEEEEEPAVIELVELDAAAQRLYRILRR